MITAWKPIAGYLRQVNKPWHPEELPADLGCTRESGVRAPTTLVCEVRQGVRPWKRVQLKDISRAGFRIEWLPSSAPDIPLRIRIPGLQLLSAHIRWHHEREVGCAFAEPLHVAVFEHIVRYAQGAGRS